MRREAVGPKAREVRNAGRSLTSERRGRGLRLWVIRIAVLMLCGAVPEGVSAQGPSSGLGVGGAFQIYGFGTPSEAGLESIALISSSFAASAALTRYAQVQVRGAYGEGIVTRPNGSEARLSGPTDTEARLNLFFGNGAVTLTGIALIPTSTSTHTLEEAEVAGRIAADLLPFRITNWGSGGGGAV